MPVAGAFRLGRLGSRRESVASAEFEPIQIFDQFLESRSPGRRLYNDLFAITLGMVAEQIVGMLTGLIDFLAHVTPSERWRPAASRFAS